MKKKMIHLAVVIMMFTAIACGGADTDKTGIKETEQNQESEENKNSQQEKIETSDKKGEKEESEESAEGNDTEESEEPTDQEASPSEKTEGDVTETQMQELYKCIKESVETDYLEPNGISPGDFVWPKKIEGNWADQDELAWHYLTAVCDNYVLNGTMYDISDFPPDLPKPSQQYQELMNAVFNGILNWYKIPENSSVNLVNLPNRWDEVLPANVDFSAE